MKEKKRNGPGGALLEGVEGTPAGTQVARWWSLPLHAVVFHATRWEVFHERITGKNQQSKKKNGLRKEWVDLVASQKIA